MLQTIHSVPKFTLLRREKQKVNQVKTLVIKCVLRDIQEED